VLVMKYRLAKFARILIFPGENRDRLLTDTFPSLRSIHRLHPRHCPKVETHKSLFCSHNIFGGKKGVGVRGRNRSRRTAVKGGKCLNFHVIDAR